MSKTPGPKNSNSKMKVIRKEAAAPKLAAKKRDNTFSKSRDTREDRGVRQAKTTHSSQTFAHGK